MEKKPSKSKDKIIIQGARVNNLKNIDVDVPRDKFVVITGLSGSGKSSLAFDTIYAEGNRRYMESLASRDQSFLDISAKPDVDSIENLSPAIAIDQKSISRSARSTVGTLTEIYDYLRILFARFGEPHCPSCRRPLRRLSNREILDEILKLPDKSQLIILSQPPREKEDSRTALRRIQQMGFARIFFEGKVQSLNETLAADNQIQEEIFIVIDRIILERDNVDRERILDSIETAMRAGKGSLKIIIDGREERRYNRDFICRECQVKVGEITPRHFSFNSPEGACPECSGLGMKPEIDVDLVIPNKKLSLVEGAIQPWSKSGGKIGNQNNYIILFQALGKKFGFSPDVPVRKLDPRILNLILYGDQGKEIELETEAGLGGVRKNIKFGGVITGLMRRHQETKSEYLRSEIERYMVFQTCPACLGKRLKKEILSIFVDKKSIDDLVNLPVNELVDFFSDLNKKELFKSQKEAVVALVNEMVGRLQALTNVGLEYLTLSRSAQTISGGEAQRIRLAKQIKSQLMGLIYVLDEPSIGLHSRDTEKLIGTIRQLRDAGNSLILVEHDAEVMKSSDWIIDLGPGAGEAGGMIVFEGTSKKLLNSKTLTGKYLSGEKKVIDKKQPRPKSGKKIEIIGAEEHNLKKINVAIPLERFVTICGVSGSGKSTLMDDILSKALSRHFYNSKAAPGKHKNIKGLSNIDKVIAINQDSIGRTPRSNAATYTGIFSHVREVFASTDEAKSRGFTPTHFSFNMKGGRCEVCQGEGMKKIEMHLMPDMYIQCEACSGTRYSTKILEVEHQGVNIAEVLDMSVSYALQFFRKHPLIFEKLKTMEEVGLGYLKLGQSATNLSGGEAQRIKLATELARKSTGKTLYILDEPTIGLHFEDTKKLIKVLETLVEKKNSVITVEHNLDFIRNADWVIELGPEGGARGGEVIYEGFPDKLKNCKKSWTAKYL
jgi:excinuclease ABC subunit A